MEMVVREFAAVLFEQLLGHCSDLLAVRMASGTGTERNWPDGLTRAGAWSFDLDVHRISRGLN